MIESRRPLSAILLPLVFALPLSLASPLQAQRPGGETPSPESPQTPEPESDAARKAAIASVVSALAEQGIAVDLEQKTVSIAAEVGRPTDPLEYLLITPRGKDHESLLVTQVQPSLLNSALLMLGLEKGINATTKERDPQPTEEEIRAGVPWFDVIPPSGQKLWFTVSWTEETEDGEPISKRAPIEDWILDFSTEKPIGDCEWIYLGGRLGPLNRGEEAVFLGDYTGDLISVCYRDPANHLVTVSHDKANNDDIWWLTAAVPAPGTAITFGIHLTETDLHRARRERLAREAAEDAEKKGEETEGDEKGGADAGKRGA